VGSLILAKQMASSDECNVECSFECTCFIMMFADKICQLFNMTAKDYVVPRPNINPEIVFFYKANYIDNGRLFLLDSKIFLF